MQTRVAALYLFLAFSVARAQEIDMSGMISYNQQGDLVNLQVQRIDNYRSLGSISGTLVLQLWATSTFYTGSNIFGYKMADVNLGQLNGGFFWSFVNRNAFYFAPPDGTYNIVMVLSEWQFGAYRPIDWYNFGFTTIGPVAPPAPTPPPTPPPTPTPPPAPPPAPTPPPSETYWISSVRMLPPIRTVKAGKPAKLMVMVSNESTQSLSVPVTFTSSNPAVPAPNPITVMVPGKKKPTQKAKTGRGNFTVSIPASATGSAVITAAVGALSSSSTLTIKAGKK